MTNTTFTVPTVVLAAIVVIFGIVAIAVKIIQKKKKGESVDLYDYVDNIIVAIQRAINILLVNMDSFEDKTDYMKCVVGTTIGYLKEDASSFGIPNEIINLISEELLTDIVVNIIDGNYFKCFEGVEPSTISEHEELFDPYFVKCNCEIDGCTCNKNKCDCKSTDFDSTKDIDNVTDNTNTDKEEYVTNIDDYNTFDEDNGNQ